MATAESLAIRRAGAIERLQMLAEQSGNFLVIPTQGRDPLHVQASQLEALAAWAESAVGTPAELTDIAFGTELARRMVENGITTQSTKAEIVAFLEVYLDGAG